MALHALVRRRVPLRGRKLALLALVRAWDMLQVWPRWAARVDPPVLCRFVCMCECVQRHRVRGAAMDSGTLCRCSTAARMSPGVHNTSGALPSFCACRKVCTDVAPHSRFQCPDTSWPKVALFVIRRFVRDQGVSCFAAKPKPFETQFIAVVDWSMCKTRDLIGCIELGSCHFVRTGRHPRRGFTAQLRLLAAPFAPNFYVALCTYAARACPCSRQLALTRMPA